MFEAGNKPARPKELGKEGITEEATNKSDVGCKRPIANNKVGNKTKPKNVVNKAGGVGEDDDFKAGRAGLDVGFKVSGVGLDGMFKDGGAGLDVKYKARGVGLDLPDTMV